MQVVPGLVELERALDLGCGTGTDTLYLATHGWDVTAVDMVPQALATARQKATAAGVSPRFLKGDVTRLHDLGVGDGYTLVLDFGCFHTLPRTSAAATSPKCPTPPRQAPLFCSTGSGDLPKPHPCTPV